MPGRHPALPALGGRPGDLRRPCEVGCHGRRRRTRRRRTTAPNGSTSWSTPGGMAWVSPSPSSTRMAGVVAAAKRNRPRPTTILPHVPGAIRWARRRPVGMVSWSQIGVVRTWRSVSGISARSQSGHSSGVPSRAVRPSVVEHPQPRLERGAMADVLVVPAQQFGDPVPLVVLVVAGDVPLHDRPQLPVTSMAMPPAKSARTLAVSNPM